MALLSKFKVGVKVFDVNDEDTQFGIITQTIKNGYIIEWYEKEKYIGDETDYKSSVWLDEILKGDVVLLN